MKHVWMYGKGQWTGRLPSLGGDEYGRRTLVLPLPQGRALVWAFRTCKCGECDETRAQTRRWEMEESQDAAG